MKKSITAAIMVLGILGMTIGFLMGQGGGHIREVLRAASVKEHGTILLAGSTSMERLAHILSESFMGEYAGVAVTAEFIGSSAGVEAVLDGRADLGLCSRNLTEEEKTAGAVELPFAVDGIAVVTDAENPVGELTTEQLAGIYTGRIRNWREVGGREEPIVVVGREAGSGSRSAFEELLAVRDRCQYANEMDSEGAVMARSAVTPGAVGYVSLDVLNDTVHTIAVDGVEAVPENVEAGSYPLRRCLFIVTRGQIWEQSELVQEFLAYLQSEKGRKLIRMAGLAVLEKE